MHLMLNNYINHLRDREYMSGTDRDHARVKATGEVFTPTPLVQEILGRLDPELFQDTTKTFCDPSCGDGQFLSEVLIRKLEHGQDFETALGTIYGVDLMPDNVELCRERLLCGREDLRHIVNRNIVCHDALAYDYSFNGTDMTDAELRGENLGLPTSAEDTKKPKKSKKGYTPMMGNFIE